MASPSKTIKIEDSIKTELEHVYAMASYVDVEQGRFDLVRHLVSAAIDEMESLIEGPSGKNLKLVPRNNTSRVKSRPQHK